MRDLFILAVVYGSLPIILFRPFYGLMVYSWLAFMRPQDMAWGISRVSPLSQYVAIAMILGLVLSVGRERLLTFKPQTVLLILLAGWITLSTVMAVVPEMSEEIYGNYWKAILMTVLITGLVRDRNRLRWLLLLIVFSIGFLGAKRGLFGLVRGGARFDDGPGGFMSDNNSFALALNMILPLLVGLAVVEKQKIIRVAAGVAAALCLLCILFTFSRGGLLTLALVGGLLVWRSRQRFLVGTLLAVGLCGFLLFSSEELTQQYVERASSISNYEEDGSAQGRITAWTTSWRVFLDYPWTGVGPNNLAAVYARYAPGTDRFRVAHNAYFQLLAECGLPALLLFLGALGATMWRLQRLRNLTSLPWVEVQARMFQISIAAYMLGSMFLNTAYSELIYYLMGLSVGLEVVAMSAKDEETSLTASLGTGPPSADHIPWWKRPATPRRAGSPATGWMGGA
ncbi:MAG TPA: putative O-glycosylation ligase, exosortase A system-associated [Thermoanaerobaculia bacterium]|nr:putative O-glycosylation ligase, exosortase A system-associated [Thermoanaerobaculia bacterium]